MEAIIKAIMYYIVLTFSIFRVRQKFCYRYAQHQKDLVQDMGDPQQNMLKDMW